MPSELGFHLKLARAGTLVDVGASTGVFAVWFATVAGAKVESFEPVSETFTLLEKDSPRKIPRRSPSACSAA
jgi:FkbM family methyltransferase